MSLMDRSVWLRGTGLTWAAVLCALVIGAAGCETKQLGRVKPKVNSGNDPNQAKALKTVSVGKGQEALDLTKGPQKVELPQVDTFGDLPVDPVRGPAAGGGPTSRSAAEQAAAVAAAATRPLENTTVISRLSFGSQALRGKTRVDDVEVEPSWARSGSARVPPQTLKPGDVKVVRLGDKKDGCEVQYEVGLKDKDERTPVRIGIRIWGPQTLERQWTCMVSAEEGKSFTFVSREGTQIQFNVGLDSVTPLRKLADQKPETKRTSLREALGR